MSELIKVVLTNKIGMTVSLINFGARITSVKYPVIDKLKEMLVSYDSTKEFENDAFYLGATCGRVSNRISNASFAIGNETYQLPKNDGDNCLHGGLQNASLQYWEVERFESQQKVKFSLDIPDGLDGFPGNVSLSVVYELNDKGELSMDYTATTDKTTPINLTNHAYFNLGEKSGFDLELKLAASAFLERSSDGIPTGKVVHIDEMGVDFSQGDEISNLIDLNQYSQVKEEAGFDTCFVLAPEKTLKAQLLSKINRVKLSVTTDQPTIQLYTGKYLDDPFMPYQGVCLECQGYVDAPNRPEFPSIMLQPGETYKRRIVYGFSAY